MVLTDGLQKSLQAVPAWLSAVPVWVFTACPHPGALPVLSHDGNNSTIVAWMSMARHRKTVGLGRTNDYKICVACLERGEGGGD